MPAIHAPLSPGRRWLAVFPRVGNPIRRRSDTYCTATSVDTYYIANNVAMSKVTGVGSAGGTPQKDGTVIAYGIVPSNNDNGAGGSTIDVTNPFGHTVMNGPMNWSADASLFKVFPIKESVNLRFNVDAFNVFNNQGLPNPSSTTGEVCITPGGLGCNSSNSPRQLQFSARINF